MTEITDRIEEAINMEIMAFYQNLSEEERDQLDGVADILSDQIDAASKVLCYLVEQKIETLENYLKVIKP